MSVFGNILQPVKPDPFNHPILTNRGIEASVLRLDKLHPVISGNKALKLHYWVEQAIAGSYQGIMTKGGPWSNHLHATAFACKLLGLSCTAIVKNNATNLTSTLQDCATWQTELLFVDHSEFNNDNRWLQTSKDSRKLWIPMGGDGPLGFAGVKDFFDQVNFGAFDYVWTAIGSGTTLKGMLASTMETGLWMVCTNGLRRTSLERMIATGEVSSGQRLQWTEDHFGRFGSTSESLINGMNMLFEQSGIPTDIVYTGRMFLTFLEKVDAGQFKRDSRHLLIHSGGLQGNRSVKGLTFPPTP